MKIQPYTFYFSNGQRSLGFGVSVSTAFSNAGYGGGAISVIDWFDRHIVPTHNWVNGKWVEREVVTDSAVGNTTALADLPSLIEHSKYVQHYFDAEKTLAIIVRSDGGRYSDGFRRHLTILVAEKIGPYVEGAFTDWATLGSLYFDHDDYEPAAAAFKSMIENGWESIKRDYFDGAKSLDDIPVMFFTPD